MSNINDFKIENGVLKKYAGTGGDVVIPDGVTSIGDWAFSGCTGLTQVTIGSGVTTIGSAFSGCTGLTQVTIPDSVTAIGNYAFRDCTSLASVTIPDSVTTIGDYAFSHCTGLTSITIPDSVTKIGDSAFYGCTDLTSITIPDSVTTIGDWAFFGCTGLTQVTIGSGVTAIGDYDFSGCTGLTQVTIGSGVTTIGDGAFKGCTGLTSITIPDSVTKIGGSAFENCTGLTQVTIPDSVNSIVQRAFYGCTGLTSITIPNSVTSIGNSAFSDCTGLKMIAVAPGNPVYQSMGNCLIEKESKIMILGCSTSVIPADGSVTSIGSAFSGCTGLTQVTIPDSVTAIGNYAFRDCTSLASVTIPDSVTSIGWWAFEGCVGLTQVTIGSGVTTICNSAFEDCTGLKMIAVAPGNPVYQSTGNCLIEKESKKMILGCSISVIPADGSVTSIGNSAFSGCTGLTSITIPDSVTSIGYSAFSGCTGLTSITIPDSVTSIGEDAFSGCVGLTQVTIGSGVTSIGKSAFSGCTDLTQVTIGSGVTSIGMLAFKGCTSLASVTIPDSVTSIGDSAFSGCKNVTIDLPDLNCLFSLPLDPIVLQEQRVKEILIQGEPVRAIPVNGKAKFGKFFIAFMNRVKDVELYLDDKACKAGESLPPEAMEWIEPTGEQLACFLLYQSGKKWETYLREAITKENANEVIKTCVEILRKRKKIKSKQAQAIADTALNYGKDLEGDTVRGLSEALTALKQPNAELDKLAAKAGNSHVPADPAEEKLEQFADACDRGSEEYKTAASLIEKGFSLKGSGKSTTHAAAALVAQFIRIWKEICTETRGEMSYVEILDARSMTAYHTDPFFHDCDEIVRELDHDEFIAFLKEKIGGKHYRPFLIPFCAYATEQEIPWLIAGIRGDKRGNAQSRYKAGSAEAALLLSETRAAAMYLDSAGLFSLYAAFHGVDPEVMRIRYLYNFDLDENGEKIYDLGAGSVTLRLDPDLSLTLSDGGKKIGSIPKKGSDPDKYEAAKKHFADMKSMVKKVAKSVSKRLRGQFYRGASYEKNTWQEQYCVNPVLRSVARLIVWKQGGKTFMLTDKGPADVTGAPYTLTDENIFLAHPMEMAKEEVAAWQKRLLSNSLKQPFDQMWEPVADLERLASDRYSGCEIPLFRFNEQWGIDLQMDTEYNHRSGCYEYVRIDICPEDCVLEWEPASGAVADLNMQSMIRIKSFTCGKVTRMTNHIVAYLDKCTVYGKILKGDVTIKDQLDGFTAAQIAEFIRIASENKCVQVSALLLEYKQTHYADLDPMAEFTLDL